MRMYDLAIFLVLFAVIMGILDDSLQFTGGNVEMGNAQFNSSDFGDMPEVANSGQSELGWGDRLYGQTFGQLGMIGNIVGRVFYIQDIIITIFGGGEDAESISWVIQVGIWMVYAMGLFQVITGRSIKVME